MPEIKTFSKYAPVSKEQLKNEVFVDSVGEAAQLVNNALLVYSQAQRVQQNMLGNFYTDSTGEDIVLTIPANKTRAVFGLNTDGFLTGAGQNVKAWIRVKTDSVNDTHLNLQCGRHTARVENIESTTFDWVSIEVACDPVESVTLKESRLLRMFVEAGDTDMVVTIQSVSVNGLSPVGRPSYVDLSASKIGTPDYPYSAAMTTLLNDNIKACHGARLPRSNIVNHCTIPRQQNVTSAYIDATNFDGFGNYIIRKAAGVTDIDGLILLFHFGAGTSRTRIGLYTTGGTLVNSVELDQAVTGPTWRSFTFGSLSSDETEYEIRLDAKEQVASISSVQIRNIFIAEKLDGGAEVDHTVPSKSYVQMNDDVLAQSWQRVNKTIEQAWKRKRQILLNDRRMNNSFLSGNYSDAGLLTSGVVHPSHDARHLICRAWISKPSQARRGALKFDGQTGNFTLGLIVTGANSGATGLLRVQNDAGATGTLYLEDINGTFLDNENITDTSTGAAVVNELLYTPTFDTRLKFALLLDTSTPAYSDPAIFEDEKILHNRPDGQSFSVDFKIPIPSEYWNDYALYSGAPLVFRLTSDRTMDGLAAGFGSLDDINLHNVQVYEECRGFID